MIKDPQSIKVIGNQLTFVGKTYRCAIGKNGFAANKKEGDGCTPLGVFPLRELWYRADKLPAPKTDLPLKIITKNDGWCDDTKSPDYNKHITLGIPIPLGEYSSKLPLPLGEGGGEGSYVYRPAKLIEYARKLRKGSTSPEAKLWSVLRNRQMSGVKFRRQHPIDIYVADFYCEELKLIIELDGESHFTDSGKASDAIRSKYLQKNYKIIRFTNEEIANDFEGVVNSIYSIIALTPTLSQREREQKEVLSQREREQKEVLSQREREQVPRHEKLWRDDDVYDLVIPIGYNDAPVISGKGSAIFLHVARNNYEPTEGCIALKIEDLLELLPLLSPQTYIDINKVMV